MKQIIPPYQDRVVYVSVRRGLIVGVYLTILSALYLVPLGLYSPCIKEKGTLGPAPALIGHRGAPMVRNNLMRQLPTCKRNKFGH